MRGFIIGAPRSGSGKTTLTLALLAAGRRRGLPLRAAKSGPDYIDPAFHEAATGYPSFNLDSWAMDRGQLGTVAGYLGSENLVIESSMGLFDGVAGPAGRAGAGADLAARFALPVVLVMDVSGHSQTAAAVARGFLHHAPGVNIAGVVLNRVASERHRLGVEEAMARVGIPVLGSIPRDAVPALPERHLGLVQALEHKDLPETLGQLADMAEACLNVPAIFALGEEFEPGETGGALLPPPGQRVAVARDEAFSFIYAHVLEGWRRAGCEIAFFSPLADEAPAQNCDACWLPGGYPELHAGRLAAAGRFKSGLAAFAQNRPVHGECGGYMVLGETLQSAGGEIHEMAGLLSHATSFAKRKMNLGYRQAIMLADSPLGLAGAHIRGHEFHYASVVTPGTDAPLADLCDGLGKRIGPTGGRRGQVSGAFFHAIAAGGEDVL